VRSKSFLDSALLLEERRSTILYFGMVYLVSLVYHLFYYYYFPVYVVQRFYLERFIVISMPIIVMTLLIPVVFYVVRTKFMPYVKYAFISLFVVFTIISDLISYSMIQYYYGGNIGEVIMVVFAAIFVNPAFFWFATVALLMKYVVVSLVYPLLLSTLLLPLGLSGLVSVLGYVILRRFMAYVRAINTVYNDHFSNMVTGIIAMLELKTPIRGVTASGWRSIPLRSPARWASSPSKN